MTPSADLIGLALAEARLAADLAEIPIGAVVVSPSGAVLGRGHNRRGVDHDPTAHAEVLALRAAGAAFGSWQLTGCTLAVTLEPCTMCSGAIVLARVSHVVFGAWDPKAGAVGSVRDVVRDQRLNHRATVEGGVRAPECAALLDDFFADRR